MCPQFPVNSVMSGEFHPTAFVIFQPLLHPLNGRCVSGEFLVLCSQHHLGVENDCEQPPESDPREQIRSPCGAASSSLVHPRHRFRRSGPRPRDVAARRRPWTQWLDSLQRQAGAGPRARPLGGGSGRRSESFRWTLPVTTPSAVSG
ncbi:hypothetical protein ACFPRL_23185 [Pseudoclavibacter helvolus]